jgi:hypothetical protein
MNLNLNFTLPMSTAWGTGSPKTLAFSGQTFQEFQDETIEKFLLRWRRSLGVNYTANLESFFARCTQGYLGYHVLPSIKNELIDPLITYHEYDPNEDMVLKTLVEGFGAWNGRECPAGNSERVSRSPSEFLRRAIVLLYINSGWVTSEIDFYNGQRKVGILPASRRYWTPFWNKLGLYGVPIIQEPTKAKVSIVNHPHENYQYVLQRT